MWPQLHLPAPTTSDVQLPHRLQSFAAIDRRARPILVPKPKSPSMGPGSAVAPNAFRAFCTADTTLPVDPRAKVGGNEISDKSG